MEELCWRIFGEIEGDFEMVIHEIHLLVLCFLFGNLIYSHVLAKPHKHVFAMQYSSSLVFGVNLIGLSPKNCGNPLLGATGCCFSNYIREFGGCYYVHIRVSSLSSLF